MFRNKYNYQLSDIEYQFLIGVVVFCSCMETSSISQVAPAPGPASGDLAELAENQRIRRNILKTQQSTVQTRRQQAVCVRRAFKQYGSKGNANVILDGLNMTVPKGTM